MNVRYRRGLHSFVTAGAAYLVRISINDQKKKNTAKIREVLTGVQLPRAHDAIPAGTISLSRAFEKISFAIGRHLDPNSIAAGVEEIACLVNRGSALISLTALDERAGAFFRRFLSEGALTAYVRDPETGEWLQLDSQEWDLDMWAAPLPGFSFDHVHPDDPDQPGPHGTFIRGALRPVFFRQDKFDQWFQKMFAPSKRPGRKSGTGFQHLDQPLLEEMRLLIESGSAKSSENAAQMVVGRAAGPGTAKSKARRLGRRYRERFCRA